MKKSYNNLNNILYFFIVFLIIMIIFINILFIKIDTYKVFKIIYINNNKFLIILNKDDQDIINNNSTFYIKNKKYKYNLININNYNNKYSEVYISVDKYKMKNSMDFQDISIFSDKRYFINIIFDSFL